LRAASATNFSTKLRGGFFTMEVSHRDNAAWLQHTSRFVQKLFPGIKVFRTFNAQHMRETFIREGKLDGGAVMEAHPLFGAGFA